MPHEPWRDERRCLLVRDDVEFVATDALARRGSQVLNRPLDSVDPRRLPLAKGAICFRNDPEAAGAISSIDLKVADVASTSRRAEEAGLDVTDAGVAVGGMRFRPVA
jgi:hypothetical protein